MTARPAFRPGPPPVVSAAHADLRETVVRLQTDRTPVADIKTGLELELYRLQIEEAFGDGPR